MAELEKRNEELENENQQLKDAQNTPAESEKDEIGPEALEEMKHKLAKHLQFQGDLLKSFYGLNVKKMKFTMLRDFI